MIATLIEVGFNTIKVWGFVVICQKERETCEHHQVFSMASLLAKENGYSM